MARKAAELGPLAVSRLTNPGLHAVGGVAGLYLQVLPTGARTWVLRAKVGGKRRDMGLGGFPDVPLARARDKARDARELIDKGQDPIEVRREAKAQLKRDQAERASLLTFKGAAKEYLATHGASWKNAKHRWQWENTLALAYPHFGDIAVRDVEVSHVLAVLKPMWEKRTETASRLRGRIESVLSYAKSLDEGRNRRMFPPHWLNPARWPDHLENLLPAPSKLKPGGRMEALPVEDLGGFMQKLKDVGGVGARALEFAILTAARSGEVRGATWSELDLKTKVWTIPGARMKMGLEHRVPLSAAAIAILEKQPRMAGTDLVFPSANGGQISDRTMLAVLRRMGLTATAHGFRSTFRDWCGDYTTFPREVAEAALAHAVGDAAEQAYRRGDALERRRKLMEAWAGFCAKPPAAKEAKDNVTPIRKRS